MQSGTGGGARRRWSDLWGLLARPTVSVPASVGLVALLVGAAQLGRDWHPYGDWAVAELVLRNVDRHLPLAGPYSGQRGYDHPLPLVYAIQWPTYALSGGRSSSGLAVSVWWSGAWLVFLTWLLARARAVWLGVLLVAGVAVMTNRVESANLLLPWNPTLAIVPAVAMVIVAWRVALGSRRLLPVLAGTAVWCSGAHLGYVPLALTVSALGVGGLVVTTVRRRGRSGLVALARPAVASAIVVGLLLAPMAVDIVVDRHASNPVTILDQGRPRAGGEQVPPGDLGRVLLAQLGLPPAWAADEVPYRSITTNPGFQVPYALVAVALLGVVAHRRRAHGEVVALGVALCGVGAAVAGLAVVDRGVLRPWYLLPSHAASIALWCLIAWSAGRSVTALVRSRWTPSDGAPDPTDVPVATGLLTTWGRVVAAPLVAVVAVVSMVPALHLQPATASITGTTDVLVDGVEATFPAGSPIELAGPITVDGYLTQAVALRLDRAGYDVRVPDDQVAVFGEAMRKPDGWKGSRLVLRLVVDGYPPPEDARLVASAPLDHPVVPWLAVAELWHRDLDG